MVSWVKSERSGPKWKKRNPSSRRTRSRSGDVIVKPKKMRFFNGESTRSECLEVVDMCVLEFAAFKNCCVPS
jgi:hypothetical protein